LIVHHKSHIMNINNIEKKIIAAVNANPISGKGKDKRTKIEALQNTLATSFKGNPSRGQNTETHIFDKTNKYNGYKDRADVYVDIPNDCELIIEIDATRADQVAKKLVSRLCYHIVSPHNNKPLLYVALLYQGTKDMNKDECVKYFTFCNEIVFRMKDGSQFIGCIIPDDKPCTSADFYYNTPKSTPQIVQGELFEKEAYADYLRDCGFTEGSVSCYLGAVSMVSKHYYKYNYSNVETCIKKLKSNPNTSSNNKTYLNKYLNWWQNK